MKKMMAMLLASVMVAGTFATTAFAYTGDDVQKNTSVNTAAQEADAAESANAGKDKQYYLVVYDEESGLEQWRQPVIMDIAFADDFGFGF